MQIVNSYAMRFIAVTFLLGVSGCGDSLTATATLPSGAVDNLYWSLEMNYHAINLAVAVPNNTVQLSVTPRAANGTALTGVAAVPTYTVLDTTRLRITSDGLLTALKTGNSLPVVAHLTIGNMTRADTAYVQVTNTPLASPLTTFSIQPALGDSAKWSPGLLSKSVVPVAQDANRMDVLSNLLIAYRSRRPDIASISGSSTGNLTAQGLGTALIVASTYAYGVYKSDSVLYTIGLPTFGYFDVVEHASPNGSTGTIVFSPDTLTIGVGGIVAWSNSSPSNRDSVRIVFDNPSAALPPGFPYMFFFLADSGNTRAIAPGTPLTGGAAMSPARLFVTPGVYTFHDGFSNATATVVVKQDSP
jgi:hypothetical protein